VKDPANCSTFADDEKRRSLLAPCKRLGNGVEADIDSTDGTLRKRHQIFDGQPGNRRQRSVMSSDLSDPAICSTVGVEPDPAAEHNTFLMC